MSTGTRRNAAHPRVQVTARSTPSEMGQNKTCLCSVDVLTNDEYWEHYRRCCTPGPGHCEVTSEGDVNCHESKVYNRDTQPCNGKCYYQEHHPCDVKCSTEECQIRVRISVGNDPNVKVHDVGITTPDSTLSTTPQTTQPSLETNAGILEKRTRYFFLILSIFYLLEIR